MLSKGMKAHSQWYIISDMRTALMVLCAPQLSLMICPACICMALHVYFCAHASHEQSWHGDLLECMSSEAD